MAHLYPDSKTFVDMKLKESPEKTLATFNKWIAKYKNSKPPKADILKFVNVKKLFFIIIENFKN